VFADLRSDLDAHLYADVLPCLAWLRAERVKAGVFTNSNAAVSRDSALGAQLDIYLHAGEVGASKPSPVPFMAIAQRMRVNPGRVLYVGDSYHHDVVGAHRAGMATAYLQRDGVLDGTYAEVFEQHRVLPDVVLSSLSPSELSEKVGAYMRRGVA
jgi:FMN phosphatase YigB (HAD superfamily)